MSREVKLLSQMILLIGLSSCQRVEPYDPVTAAAWDDAGPILAIFIFYLLGYAFWMVGEIVDLLKREGQHFQERARFKLFIKRTWFPTTMAVVFIAFLYVSIGSLP